MAGVPAHHLKGVLSRSRSSWSGLCFAMRVLLGFRSCPGLMHRKCVVSLLALDCCCSCGGGGGSNSVGSAWELRSCIVGRHGR